MIATFVNAAAVVAGGLIGLLAKKGLPERISKGIMAAHRPHADLLRREGVS